MLTVYANGSVTVNDTEIAKIITDPATGKRTLHMRDNDGPVTFGGAKYSAPLQDVTHIYHDNARLTAAIKDYL